jgi:hypothetical protein
MIVFIWNICLFVILEYQWSISYFFFSINMPLFIVSQFT